MKLNYSEPKIYTGGVDTSKWSKLSKSEQKAALNKDWFVYYSFRDPSTGKLKRQPFIKAGVNKLKTKHDRTSFLKTLQRNLLRLLEAGFSPYNDNSELEEQFLNPEQNLKIVQDAPKEKPVPTSTINIESSVTIQEAFQLVLDTKMQVLNQSSYSKFKSRVNRYKKWLQQKDYLENDSINKITKQTVITYLNDVLSQTSPRNRNNTRTDIGSMFQTLEDNDVIKDNFIKKINVLKATPKRNKSYTPKMQNEIYEHLKSEDPILLLFVKFISYNFLRPIEVCRLKIGDLDIDDKKLYVRAKNQPVKIKIIPDILIKELPSLSGLNKEHYLFTPNEFGKEWHATETNRRDYFSKQFRKVKDHFELGVNYGLYSFRHTFITKLYRELAKTMTPFEVKSNLMLITGHSSMKALEQYLREIDAALPQDYSHLLG